MKSYIFIKKSDLPTLPENFNSDGRFAPQLVQKLIERYSKEGDSIFDPFLGYGTTVYIAEILNRVGYGIELDRERFNYSVSICKNVNNILCDDLMNIPTSLLPEMDVCITSPTYAWRNMGCNPFNLYMGKDSYEQYLNTMVCFFKKIVQFMKNDSYIIIDTSNVIFQKVLTTLAWDVERVLRCIEEIRFEHEIVICWEGADNGFLGGIYGFGYDHSYCLVFSVHTN